jgi:N6-adenosine-specific RNA methylase IME4
MADVDANACKAYGSLTEGIHVAGYTIERGWKQLEWLLESNRWQQLGQDFKDVNAFLDSIKLDNLRIVADQRKRIAERIKELQPVASNRAIARTMGVSPQTIGRDAVPFGTAIPSKSAGKNVSNVPNGTPPPVSGAAAAKLVDRAVGKQERVEAKKEHRAERERRLADATIQASQALNVQQYSVIYADPPWRFEPYSRETGMDRAADNHYPTMTLDEIKALKIPAAPDCVLFLWATVPMLPEALEVITAWGFTYRSHFVWVKNRAGTGYWNRNQHELLLVGVRGSIPAPAPGKQYSSVIEANVGTHSAKPFHFTEMIEELFPNLPRLEMFARGEVSGGWDGWGNEANAA